MQEADGILFVDAVCDTSSAVCASHEILVCAKTDCCTCFWSAEQSNHLENRCIPQVLSRNDLCYCKMRMHEQKANLI